MALQLDLTQSSPRAPSSFTHRQASRLLLTYVAAPVSLYLTAFKSPRGWIEYFPGFHSRSCRAVQVDRSRLARPVAR
jgi:hypothetical protein